MKKFLLAFLLGGILSTTNVQALENTINPKVTDLGISNPKTGLIVGNSYSFYNCGVHSYLREFTRESQKPWKARILTMSSARLSYHNVRDYLTPNKEMDPYAKSKPMFDVVILQPESMEPISEKGKSNFQKYVKEHVKTIRQAGAIPILISTWARQNRPQDTRALADATIAVANETNALVIPVGLAFAESLKQRPDLLMHQSDKSHPTAAGSYLYGAMLYSVLFQKSPEGFKTLGVCEKPLNEKDAKYLQKIAWETVKTFYGWQ